MSYQKARVGVGTRRRRRVNLRFGGPPDESSVAVRAISFDQFENALKSTEAVPSEVVPCLCVWAQETEEGRQLCGKARQIARDLADKIERPFVACCWMGMKILVLPGKPSYLAFCRSPLPDDRRLERLEDSGIMNHPVLELQASLRAMPTFGLAFVQKVISDLSQQNVSLSDEDVTTAKILGRAYGPYELDIVLSNAVLNLPPLGKEKVSGTVCVRITVMRAKARDREEEIDACVTRVVFHRLGGDKKWQCGIPIVGFATESPPPSGSQSALQLPRWAGKALQDAEDVVLGGPQEKLRAFPPVPFSGNGWHAEICLGLPSGVNGEWSDSACRIIQAATYIGLGDDIPALITSLRQDGERALGGFMRHLRDFANPTLYRVTSRDHTSFRSMLIGDLEVALEGRSAELVAARPSVRDAIQKFLEASAKYSVLDWSPTNTIGAMARRRLLAQDILRNEDHYITRVRRDQIPACLKRWDYGKHAVHRCLGIDPEVTAAALLDDLEAGEVTGLAGGKACKAFREWCDSHPSLRSLEEYFLRELYSLTASGSHQQLVRSAATFVGMVCSALTAGIYPAWPVIEKLEELAKDRHLNHVFQEET